MDSQHTFTRLGSMSVVPPPSFPWTIFDLANLTTFFSRRPLPTIIPRSFGQGTGVPRIAFCQDLCFDTLGLGFDACRVKSKEAMFQKPTKLQKTQFVCVFGFLSRFPSLSVSLSLLQNNGQQYLRTIFYACPCPLKANSNNKQLLHVKLSKTKKNIHLAQQLNAIKHHPILEKHGTPKCQFVTGSSFPRGVSMTPWLCVFLFWDPNWQQARRSLKQSHHLRTHRRPGGSDVKGRGWFMLAVKVPWNNK